MAEPDFIELLALLKQAVNQPLPAGRGFQLQHDRHIQSLARQLANADLPIR